MSSQPRRALKNMASTVPHTLDPIPESSCTLSSQPGLPFPLDEINAALSSTIPCPPPSRPSTSPPTGERRACQPTTPDPNLSALPSGPFPRPPFKCNCIAPLFASHATTVLTSTLIRVLPARGKKKCHRPNDPPCLCPTPLPLLPPRMSPPLLPLMVSTPKTICSLSLPTPLPLPFEPNCLLLRTMFPMDSISFQKLASRSVANASTPPRVHLLPDPACLKQLSWSDSAHPDAFIKIMRAGWTKYFAIHLLTNERSRAALCVNPSYSKTVSFTDGRIKLKEAELDPSGKRNITYSDLREAATCFIKLIDQYLNSPHRHKIANLWYSHYEILFNRSDLQVHFPLYVLYDIRICLAYIRCLATFSPAAFHQAVWDEILEQHHISQISAMQSYVKNLQSLSFWTSEASGSTSSTTPAAPHLAPPIQTSSHTSAGSVALTPTNHVTAQSLPLLSLQRITKESGRALATSQFALPGTGQEAAKPPLASMLTSALAAGPANTMGNPTLRNYFFPIVTPLLWQQWDHMWCDADALHLFPDVPTGIRDGFCLGVSSTIASMFLPLNHNSSIQNSNFVQQNIAKELECGHYSPPLNINLFSRAFGHFCSSPLGVTFNPSCGF
ncbi:hypothetical protein SERLADRAFT_440618 [Serpula lacrymans var. lacrymans S7.9]|nr:uncharacterized protein SERLADRAFT_440618 [Serpula lacrymans var. lacrymans S7.9]EGO22605.1 hypothetical protein SERLADRAFT_440618 [Serpula lacrymans var. lacrymans S7.9]